MSKPFCCFYARGALDDGELLPREMGVLTAGNISVNDMLLARLMDISDKSL